MGFIVANLFAG